MKHAFVIFGLLVAVNAHASTATADTPVAVDVVRAADRAYVVTAAFDVDAKPEIVWQVLTDYDGIGNFVSSIRESTVKRREPGRVLLEQAGVGHAWFVSLPMHVILEVQEDGAHTALSFKDVCGRSFNTYEGSWKLTAIDGGTHVVYTLKADPVGAQPGFLARPAMRGNVQALLDDVRREILMRAR